MRKLTASVYTFEDLRKGDFLYVDKTEYIWKMVAPAKGMYFLSRPRRFGKSLTISTLKALFNGKRELFRGLAIDNKPYDWIPHPVLHLDLGNCNSQTAENLREFLGLKLEDIARQFALTVSVNYNQLSSTFSRIIREIYSKQGQVVILVDEYDKPMLENLTNGNAIEIREVLSDFYSAIKLEDACERFVLLTGVTKFCQVSVFSKLNNLQDISMNADFATMLGYTQEELEANFKDWLVDVENHQELSHDVFLAKIKDWYDGFRFEEKAESVYNPVSIASFFSNHGKFSNYWFSTGTPTFLMELLKQTHFDLEKVLSEPVDEIAFAAYEIEKINPLTLLLQTGYLTIKQADRKWDEVTYLVDFPNLEVKAAFNTYLLDAYSGVSRLELKNHLTNMLNSMNGGQTADFMEEFQTFLANIPYDIQLKNEKYYQSVIYVLFLTLGARVQAEVCTNKGRIDAVVSFDAHLYIIEFKINKSAKEALEQIRSMEYYQRYRNNEKSIHLLGINLSTIERQITEWLEDIDCRENKN